jgi:TrmH family RNA methyltransferase
MGSLARVNIHYADLAQVLPRIELPIFGAMLNGENIYNTHFGSEGLLVMGNEGNGISADIERLITSAVTIPRAGNAESLNVAIATAILCSEIKRNSMK